MGALCVGRILKKIVHVQMSWTDSGVGDDAVVKHVTSECVSSTPTTVAPHAHFLVRTWLKPQGAALVLSTFFVLEKISSPSRHVVTLTVSTRRSTLCTAPSTCSLPTRTTWRHHRFTVGRLAVLSSRVCSQNASPTPPWRLSALRTHLRNATSRRQVSVPHIIQYGHLAHE